MGQNSIKSFFLARRAKKGSAKGRIPPQELEVGPRSEPYLLVFVYFEYTLVCFNNILLTFEALCIKNMYVEFTLICCNVDAAIIYAL